VYIADERIFLLTVYDKADQETVSDTEIKTFIKALPIE